eukprot:TRINITY_DN3123_c0_g1_i3.p1 TRINITY_DN3123_c0_g1~~TRINITY_DN3123_c0_g1_i3.p1  ORF type:complete len:974 (-),score=92.97 TRINITY_DN3123_c0_g1_i3:1444-4365(-)
MRNSYTSPLLIAALCATLSACGSDNGAATETPVATSFGTMASASLAETTYIPSQTPSSWTACATEDKTCSFAGTAQVRYGTADKYFVKTVTGPVACTNAVFGDPAPGYAKSCSLGVTPVATTSSTAAATSTTTWSVCAKEDGNCSFSGSAQVRYGTADKYVTKTLTGPVACTNAVFGDPAPGYAKSCTVGIVTATTPSTPDATPTTPTTTPSTPTTGTPSSWAVCATEGGTCAVSGSAQVRYGTATQYVTKTVTGPVACTNAVFGDPAPNYGKACSIGLGASADPAPTSPTPTTPTSPTSPAPTPTPTPAPVPAPTGGAITTVQLINATASAQTNAAATFGQTFTPGDVRSGETLVGRNAAGASVPLQVDVKARHADGSLRHAVITAQLASSAANGTETVSLVKATATAAAAPATPVALLNSGFTAAFNATIGGVRYTASADELLKSGKYTTWLSGALVNEWLVQAPLKNASGVAHPHLMAQFAIRSYAGSNSARVDVTVENGWAFEASPQNFTYDAQMVVGGQSLYSQAALTHYHHARWRKIFWWGKAQALNVRHNTKYLIASKALPNYDQSLTIKEATIATWKSQWTASKNGPMQPALGMSYMPTTGARSDIGLMPTWSALFLLSMDQRMKDVALGMSEAAGSWSAHYRDKNTGRPVTLASYPYLARSPIGATNPATNKSEALPECPTTACSTPLTADTPHQPAFAYVPYLVTGDYYHLEELQFWANFNSFQIAPQYREAGKGLVMDNQVRGQAWTLRTVAEAAYITPDNDPQKASLTAIVNHNIDYYNTTYTNNTAANKLGVVTNGYAIEYDGNTGLAPWQDDFLTSAIGHMVELGFTNAQPFLVWKSKFVVDRMVGAGYCWVQAPAYNLKVRDSYTAPFYTSIAQAYQATNPTTALLSCGSSALASALQVRTGEMVGTLSPIGQQGIMQPALAYAVSVNANGAKAWAQFASRAFKPDYTQEPNYAILPR